MSGGHVDVEAKADNAHRGGEMYIYMQFDRSLNLLWQ